MKRILITNDDGIRSSGIIRLVEAARALGEVTVIAPDREHSAKAHSISILEPVDFMPYAFPVPGVTAWVCSGTPSDCVRVGLAYLLPQKPDLVLSGINCGFNIASDIQYSATVGAALEAAHQGIPAAAFSEPGASGRVAARAGRNPQYQFPARFLQRHSHRPHRVLRFYVPWKLSAHGAASGRRSPPVRGVGAG